MGIKPKGELSGGAADSVSQIFSWNRGWFPIDSPLSLKLLKRP